MENSNRSIQFIFLPKQKSFPQRTTSFQISETSIHYLTDQPFVLSLFFSTVSWDLAFFNFLFLCFPFQTEESFVQLWRQPPVALGSSPLQTNHLSLFPTQSEGCMLVRECSRPKAVPSPLPSTPGAFQSKILWPYVTISWTWFTIHTAQCCPRSQPQHCIVRK